MFNQVYLTGYRGTGKSSVGRILADSLGGVALDLDDLIESQAKMSIREIFDAGGEKSFRDWETQCLRGVAAEGMLSSNSCQTPPISRLASACGPPQKSDVDSSTPVTRVVALGGGAILRQENRDLIRSSGVCIWLDASAQALAIRLADDDSTATRRPALTDLSPTAEIEKLLSERRPVYLAASDTRIDTDHRSVEQVAEVALDWLRSR